MPAHPGDNLFSRPGSFYINLNVVFIKPVLTDWIALAVILCFLAGCVTKPPARHRSVYQQTGLASYYARKLHGRKTASGERYNEKALTAAHRFLPFGAKVRVTNLQNRRSVIVRINDRGPFIKGRIIDVSYAAARELKMVRQGVARVKVARVP